MASQPVRGKRTWDRYVGLTCGNAPSFRENRMNGLHQLYDLWKQCGGLLEKRKLEEKMTIKSLVVGVCQISDITTLMWVKKLQPQEDCNAHAHSIQSENNTQCQTVSIVKVPNSHLMFPFSYTVALSNISPSCHRRDWTTKSRKWPGKVFTLDLFLEQNRERFKWQHKGMRLNHLNGFMCVRF